MQSANIFIPALALFAWQMLVALVLLLVRIEAIRRGRIHLAYYRLKRGARQPEIASRVDRNYTNLFESPFLFYTILLFALFYNYTAQSFLILAWLYVGLRIAHSIVHISLNFVPLRLGLFLLSMLTLTIMWGQLGLHVLV